MDNTKSSMMTKEEFAIKHGHINVMQGTIDEKFLSDLNALLRNELIKYEMCSQVESFEEAAKWIDEYLKSQQQ